MSDNPEVPMIAELLDDYLSVDAYSKHRMTSARDAAEAEEEAAELRGQILSVYSDLAAEVARLKAEKAEFGTACEALLAHYPLGDMVMHLDGGRISQSPELWEKMQAARAILAKCGQQK